MKKSLEINSYAIEYLSGGVLREVFVNNAVGGREEREETAEGIGLRREDLVSGAAARLGSKRQAPRRRHDGVTTASRRRHDGARRGAAYPDAVGS